ncbi:GNAT family N-acetyltransferase, partial [Paucibacter sp. AS339]|uniref:GNAT family N-acetyltransferase n=1 Tax=Paucibacter hankyongi TaxID=3133434 RepID=UPI00309787A1
MDLTQLRRENRSGVIVLSPLATEESFTWELISALRAQGYWVRTFHCFGNWYFQTNGKGFSEYLAERPSQLRNTLRRAQGKLNKLGNWNIELHKTTGVELERAIRDYDKVYGASWKPSEADPEFVFSLIRMAAEQGSLRLGLLKIEGEALAAQLWFVKGGVASIYKLAYVENAAPLSLGTVLSAFMFEHVLDYDRVDEIDFLNGDEPYKREWMSARRVRIGIHALDLRRPPAWGAAIKQLVGDWLRKLT